MKNIRLFVFLCLGLGLVLSPALQVSAKAPATAKIAFSSNRDGNWEIYLMNPDGSQQKRLTQNSARDSSPVWSPRWSTDSVCLKSRWCQRSLCDGCRRRARPSGI